MGDGLLYLEDYITGEPKTYDFTPLFEGYKVVAVNVAVFEGRLEAGDLYAAEVHSNLSLDAEGWATLLAWVRAVLEAKKI